MARALVTGITGFVGGHLAEHLLGCGDEVLGIAAPNQALPEPASRVAALEWDLGRDSPETIAEPVARFAPQHVYHLAAISIPADCGLDTPAPEAWAINVEGTRRVLEMAAGLNPRPRLLVMSSSHVYGSSAADRPLDEQVPLDPRGGYGRTKLAAERAAHEARRRYGLEVVVVRAFQQAGPRQSPRMMLSAWARQFAAGADPVEVHTLDFSLDLSDVRDTVRAYRLLLERAPSGEIYNVGSGRACSGRELLAIFRRLAGPRRIVQLHPACHAEPVANIAKLTARTGWTPETPIETTVADTLDWWKGR